MSEPKETFAAAVWDNLSKVDCSGYIAKIERGGGIPYLPWGHAWAILMERYPESSYSFDEPVYLPDGTVEIWCSVTVADGGPMGEKLTRKMWLPVMDNRNIAIENPSSRAISDTRMRCMVKCVGLFGLGHYLYTKDDAPRLDRAENVKRPEPITDEQLAEITKLVKDSGADEDAVKRYFKVENLADLKDAQFPLVKGMLEKKLRQGGAE